MLYFNLLKKNSIYLKKYIIGVLVCGVLFWGFFGGFFFVDVVGLLLFFLFFFFNRNVCF